MRNAKPSQGSTNQSPISPLPAVCCVTTGRHCWVRGNSKKLGHHSSPSLLGVRKPLRETCGILKMFGIFLPGSKDVSQSVVEAWVGHLMLDVAVVQKGEK